MKKFLMGETRFGYFLKTVVNLVILNFLFVLCCLPVITAGASFTALYHSVSAITRGEEQMTKTFFKSFKNNIKQSTILWIGALLLGFLLYWGVYIISFWETNRSLFLMLMALPCFLYVMILSYAFPLLADFETTLPRLLSNSILLGIAHFPRSILIVAINLLPVVFLYVMPSWIVCAVFIWLPVGFSLCAFVNCLLLKPVFAPYRPEEEETEDQ